MLNTIFGEMLGNVIPEDYLQAPKSILISNSKASHWLCYTMPFLECRPQHCGWWWHLWPANRRQYPRCTVACDWIKLQIKIIVYLITYVGNVVLLHPYISGIFLGNVHFHELIQFPKYSEFHAWYLLSILLLCGGFAIFIYRDTWKIKWMQRNPTQ